MTRKYEFALVLAPDTELTEELADQLFAAGCDDGTPGMFSGRTYIQFTRDAATLEDAIRSAIANVKLAGCGVSHAELDEEALASLQP